MSDNDEQVARVAHWLATEYGDDIGEGPPGYWEFQARELLGVVRGEEERTAALVRCDCCHREVEEAEQTEDICHDCYPDCSANYCAQIDETRGGW